MRRQRQRLAFSKLLKVPLGEFITHTLLLIDARFIENDFFFLSHFEQNGSQTTNYANFRKDFVATAARTSAFVFAIAKRYI